MKNNWGTASTLEQGSFIYLCISLLKQNITLPYAINSNAYRDACLAENLYQNLRLSPSLKTILWAHNSHVSKENKPARPMGNWLKQTYEKKYKAVGIAFGSGTYRALYGNHITSVSAKKAFSGSYEYFFQAAEMQNLYINLENLTLKNENKWLFERSYFRQTGAEASDQFEMQGILNAYDALIYIENSTPTNGLNSSR